MARPAPKKINFNVSEQYEVLELIGEGAYGIVCAALHRPSGQKVAIKKITPFDHSMFCLRTLREMKLLKYFSHENVSPPSSCRANKDHICVGYSKASGLRLLSRGLSHSRAHGDGYASRDSHAGALRRPLSVLYLPVPARLESPTLSQCPAPGFKALQSAPECELRLESMRLWTRPVGGVVRG